MARITTVIFDMYETLVQNPHQSWKVGFEGVIREQSLDITVERLWREWSPVEAEFRESRVQPGVAFRSYFEAWRDCFSHSFDVLGLPGDAHAASRSFIRYISRRDPYPETIEALRAVKSRWRTAVLSNADDDYLLPNLAQLELDFEAVLTSEKARMYKPLPGLFLEMLRMLDVTPEESVYVGDRQFEDVQGASNVGMPAVWINRSGVPMDPQLPEPAYEIRSLLELPALLRAWPPAEDGFTA